MYLEPYLAAAIIHVIPIYDDTILLLLLLLLRLRLAGCMIRDHPPARKTKKQSHGASDGSYRLIISYTQQQPMIPACDI